MTAAMTSTAVPESIQATIRYVVKGEKAVFYPAEREKSYWPADDHRMTLLNLRRVAELPTIERNGFALIRHESAVRNFHDEAEVERVFFPEMVELAMRINGAAKAIAFGPVARSDDPRSKQGRLPSFGAHVDYGRRTIEEITRGMLGEEAEHWLAKRVVLMNFWRPIKPVQRTPLALCDASTVQPDDLYDSEIRGGLDDPNRPPLYGFNLSWNPDHRWYYVSDMQPGEVFAFKLYDSDPSRPQWTGHTAIEDPNTPPDAAPRESMEIRTISFIG